jgi:hypothetical protein
MKISKLQYPNKETALTDLIAKGVYVESDNELIYGQGIHAIVEIGSIVLIDGIYDEDGKEITAPIYADGYHYDIMSENKIDFGSAEIKVNNPKHVFAGYENKLDVTLIEINE